MASITEILLKDLKHDQDLQIKSGTGDLDTIEGLDNIKEAIRRRLVTRPGELVHRPDYGVGLPDFQNAPLTLATKQEIARRIENNLKRESRVRNVTSVSFDNEDLTPDQVLIKVKFNIIGYGETDVQFAPFGEVY